MRTHSRRGFIQGTAAAIAGVGGRVFSHDLLAPHRQQSGIRVVTALPTGPMSPVAFNEREQYDLLTPMRDGVRLAMDLVRPDREGPCPVVLMRTPYDKVRSRASGQVSDLATGRMARWHSTLPPSPTRLAYLNEVLQVGDLEANLIQAGQVRLTVPLHNRGARPLTIRYDDISVRQGTEPVTVPAFGQEAGAVAAGASTELTLDIVLPRPDASMIVTVGRSVFEVQLPEGR